MYQGLSLEQAPPEDIPFRFFLSAPLFGILAGLFILYEGKSILISNWSIETVILTHLLTLGWVAMVMLGSIYQMIPVLVGGSVPEIMWARWLHGIFVLGILCLGIGLYSFEQTFLAVATIFLFLTLFGFCLQALYALFAVAANNRPTVWAMRISVISLLATIFLGMSFIGNLSGWWHLPFSRGGLIGMHLSFGLFGWIATLVIGVGFHVVPMFYLTKPFPPKLAYQILSWIVISLVLLPIGFFFGLDGRYMTLLGLPGGWGIVLFCYQTFKLFHQRRRKLVDSTIRFWQSGLVFLLLSLILGFIDFWIPDDRFTIGFGFLFLFGFSISLTNGMLYKIVPFLIWFHRCSNLIGVPDVPLMKDILADKQAKRQWLVYLVSVLVLGAGLAFKIDWLVRTGGVLFAVSSAVTFILIFKGYRLKVPEGPQFDMAAMMKMMEKKED